MTKITRTANLEVYHYHLSSYCDFYRYSSGDLHLKNYVRFPECFVLYKSLAASFATPLSLHHTGLSLHMHIKKC